MVDFGVFMGKFDQIRPFNDNEVQAVIKRIIADTEMQQIIVDYRFGYLPSFLKPMAKKVFLAWLKIMTFNVKTVYQAQMLLKSSVEKMIESTISEFSYSGIDKLNKSQSYLFISNHRDIALDPLLVNYALYLEGLDTVRIAIGDNLLSKGFVSDLMRLNKSFIVKRSKKAPRQMLSSLKLLSEYIHVSIQQDNESVWIAQREGRAKDALDKTDPAMLKMLSLNQRKQPLSDVINSLSVVPVAISYELDPCDEEKANELRQVGLNGSYLKQEHEDIASIAKGIKGQKGRVHLAFGEVIKQPFHSEAELASYLDQQILSLYHLHLSHVVAYEMLYGKDEFSTQHIQKLKIGKTELDNFRANFKCRVESLANIENQSYLLMQYANPVLAKIMSIK